MINEYETLNNCDLKISKKKQIYNEYCEKK